MSDEQIRQLSRRNVELAERVTQLEQLKDHWYQELVGLRQEVADLQAHIEVLEAEKLKQLAMQGLGLSDE